MFRKRKPYDPAIVKQMRSEWNKRAQDNARYYVATGQTEWSDKDFFHTGQTETDEIVLKDIDSICARRKAAEMRLLEIGCGLGRMTESLSRIFGNVDAVDTSSEMIAQPRAALSDRTNIEFHVNNGVDLSIFPGDTFDFAISMIVSQHTGFSESEVAECASRCGFQLRDSRGAGTQYYWVTLLKS